MHLPMWFLVLSIFLPRIALFIDWHNNYIFPIPQPGAALVWFFIPRVLVILMIYGDQGITAWFWIHIVIAAVTWLSAGLRTTASSSS